MLKSHKNTSKYVVTVTIFQKLEPEVIDPLDDLDDSTQGSLCPSPMGIYQFMWIQ